MSWLFLSLKILLSLLAIFFIYKGSPLLMLVFLLFVVLDIIDSKLVAWSGNKQDYRLYDTIGDRIFVYANFLSFLAFVDNLFPIILIIVSYTLRDLAALFFILRNKAFSVPSNALDKLTILFAAILFSLQIGLPELTDNSAILLTNYALVALVLFEGYDKIKRIRE